MWGGMCEVNVGRWSGCWEVDVERWVWGVGVVRCVWGGVIGEVGVGVGRWM